MGPFETIPVARYSNTGVYALDALHYQACFNVCDDSGGGFEFWWCIGKLDDLAAQITERPLYARQDDEGNWYQVEEPDGFDPEAPGLGL